MITADPLAQQVGILAALMLLHPAFIPYFRIDYLQQPST